MAGTSAGASKGWATRWENAYLEGKPLSKKGQQHIDRIFGPTIGDEGFYDEDWPDVWDFRDDDTGDCG